MSTRNRREGGGALRGPLVDLTGLTLRSSRSADVASLTVKWELELPARMAFGTHFTANGLGVMAALTDGSTPGGGVVDLAIRGLADLTG